MKVTIDKAMTEAVLAEFEADNPGKSFYEMSSAEFADRMMKKIKAGPESDAALAPEQDKCIHSWSAPFDGMVKCTKCGSALAPEHKP